MPDRPRCPRQDGPAPTSSGLELDRGEGGQASPGEYISLDMSKKIENWDKLVESCPSIDILIHTAPETDKLAEEDIRRITEKWEYFEGSTHQKELQRQNDGDNIRLVLDNSSKAKFRHWHATDLYSTSNCSKFIIRRLFNYMLEEQPEEHWFHHRISSQLLQFRIQELYGMMPRIETGGYECIWEAVLSHCGGGGALTFRDSKGAAWVSFHGTASDDALELLNFLVSVDFPRTYDAIRAGTMA